MLNINVGVLGHVDSGKTSLAKVLSTVASTSAFDKNPQSKKRGITLDLGFSSFVVDSSSYPFLPSIRENFSKVQFTLVDCPGHGSLIRTVLCGSQIIDIILLVVDVTKGFQTQTAECLVIGEIACEKMLVVLNKCDLLEENQRLESIQKMRKRILKTLEGTIFKGSGIAEVSAAPGGVQVEFTPELTKRPQEVENLITVLAQSISDPTEKRNKLKDMSFVFAVDHCFTVTGQGTILTGTVLTGTASVGQLAEESRTRIGKFTSLDPSLWMNGSVICKTSSFYPKRDHYWFTLQRIQKKIKSIQRFRQPIQSIGPGDRAGICVPQLDPNLLERGLVGDLSSDDNLTLCHACILANVEKVRHFKNPVKSKSRLHIFVGQETVIANLTFFSKMKSEKPSCEEDRLNSPKGSYNFDKTATYQYVDELCNETRGMYLLLEFEHPVVCPINGLVIGAKLDTCSVTTCRIALHGRVTLQLSDPKYKSNILSKLLICKSKSRCGQIERVVNPRACIVHGLFKRETNWEIFVGLRAHVIAKSTEDNSTENYRVGGYIESSFGQSGKCRLALDDDLPDKILALYSAKAGRKTTSETEIKVVLEFKKNIFDPQRRIIQ
ncbi:unnamed protein product [Heterobilharzia americana]|nr:unnamed protein product [Heterobilharzia americana]